MKMTTRFTVSTEKEVIIDIDDFYNRELLHTKLTRNYFEDICKDSKRISQKLFL